MYDSGFDACKADLYTDADELFRKYPELLAKKVLRVREMHQWLISNPSAKDAEFISEIRARFGVSKPTAYSDLAVLKAMLPELSATSRDFHTWRFIEMILETYNFAKARKDVRTMERATATMAKFMNIDKQEDTRINLEDLKVQPFVATDDPSILGISQIPNIRERQRALIEKYTKECIDIEEIEAEDVDLEEDLLFPEVDES